MSHHQIMEPIFHKFGLNEHPQPSSEVELDHELKTTLRIQMTPQSGKESPEASYHM